MAPRRELEVADDVAHILLGRGHDHLHDRLREHGVGLAHRFLKGHRAGDLERHLGRVDLVVRAVVERDLHVHDVVAGEHAGLHSALDTGVDRRNIFLRDDARPTMALTNS